MTSPSDDRRCVTCGRAWNRSPPQNARYWLLLHELAEKLRPNKTEFPARAYHEYYKLKFLGGVDLPLPNGQTLVIPRSTTQLSVQEFSDYMDKVEADAAERRVFLSDAMEAP